MDASTSTLEFFQDQTELHKQQMTNVLPHESALKNNFDVLQRKLREHYERSNQLRSELTCANTDMCMLFGSYLSFNIDSGVARSPQSLEGESFVDSEFSYV